MWCGTENTGLNLEKGDGSGKYGHLGSVTAGRLRSFASANISWSFTFLSSSFPARLVDSIRNAPLSELIPPSIVNSALDIDLDPTSIRDRTSARNEAPESIQTKRVMLILEDSTVGNYCVGPRAAGEVLLRFYSATLAGQP
ncbi:hypothetical protein NMY22_g5895 [Coprinellus aureogranulatus]|nr:hypothetical protein NMY22_g5895 [Coprinellus aureogranulatus]